MNEIKYFVGKENNFLIEPSLPFGKIEIDFLSHLSKVLMLNKQSKKYSDIISFAFWCRKQNIYNLKKKNFASKTRVGLGLIFHITPSNIPTNFAYSLILFSFPVPMLINVSLVFLFKKNIHASAISSEKISSLSGFPLPQILM